MTLFQYLLHFMVGDEAGRFVGYTSDIKRFADYKVVIVPSAFFDEDVYGTSQSEPVLPLNSIEGVPFLFGKPEIERAGDTLVVHADLVASAFFLLSRYEEVLHRNIRDLYGRFPGKESLPFRAGFIDRPVVDEYGKLIRKWLKSNGVKTVEHLPFIRKIYLTHDVDAPFYNRAWRNVVRKFFSGHNPLIAIRDKFRPLLWDPNFTFPWLFQQNKQLQSAVGEDRCISFLFFKAGGKTKSDKPRYNLKGKDIKALFELCREQGVSVGLHSSFQAGLEPSLIASELKKLEDAYSMAIKHNRHHFLSSREPEDMEYLEKAGITDDFTMGYADVAGFRLGTSQPVRFINPVTKRLSSLTLHPLVIMDGTLEEKKYMNLTAEEAEDYCMKLIQNIRNVNGDLTLLWHNTSVVYGRGYLRDLYSKLIKQIVVSSQ